VQWCSETCAKWLTVGDLRNDWQDVDYVLGFFSRKRGTAQRLYKEYQLKARGYDLAVLAERVGEIFGSETGDIYSPGKYERLKLFFHECPRFPGLSGPWGCLSSG
jgi:hypothetical protein